MLLLSKISNLTPYSEDWFNHRLAMMTGSRISCICAPKGIGVGGMTYIRNKVSEAITGVSTERNITTDGIIWGIENEPKALKEWQETNKITMIITNKHIVFDERYSVTPDGLAIMNEKLMYINNDTELNCETVESKSYMTPSVHMAHVECKTPDDIKVLNPELFWQCVSQIYWAGVLKGHAIFFHPNFPIGSPYRLGHVEFRKVTMQNDFKFFADRTAEAKQIFEAKLNYKK